MTREEKNELLEMLSEFESCFLEVMLVPCRYPCNIGGMIRVACNQNAKWYRDFCACYTSSRMRNKRKHDTKIKRRNIHLTLNKMIEGKQTSIYCNHLLSMARERIKRANERKILKVNFREQKRLQVCEEPF